MSKPLVALFGGSGFVGTVLANQLLRAGYRLRIFTRDRQHARAQWLLPDTELVVAHVDEEERIAQALKGSVAAINLVGILNERRDDGADFKRAHVDTVQHLVKAAKQARVPHFVHLSALAADVAAPSYYLRSKGQAEQLLLGASTRQFRASILRPSVIFGRGDDFLNRFASLLRFAPLLPLTGAQAELQPVYVGDVAAAVLRLLETPGAAPQGVYEIGGPDVMTLRAIVEYVGALGGRRPLIVPIGGPLATLMAWCMEWVPGKPLTRDNLRSLSVPSVCRSGNALLELGIRPTPLDEIAPAYLAARHQRGRYDHFREQARRARQGPAAARRRD
ncbi:MAG: complex I NDUFA9 subunit family protein [Proteobacteria bacterium]|nr:complex I NDUFA9 subunit family protein [Pseudomonadota bacterium]